MTPNAPATRPKLAALFAAIKAKYPEAQLSADQAYRISDYAIDFCEDVEPLPRAVIDDMVAMLEAGGATVKISSIHINTWFGDFSKQQMSRRLLTEGFGEREADLQKLVVYSGDSPNDGPMFEHFRLSVGVANIAPFLEGDAASSALDHQGAGRPRILRAGGAAVGASARAATVGWVEHPIVEAHLLHGLGEGGLREGSTHPTVLDTCSP